MCYQLPIFLTPFLKVVVVWRKKLNGKPISFPCRIIIILPLSLSLFYFIWQSRKRNRLDKPVKNIFSQTVVVFVLLLALPPNLKISSTSLSSTCTTPNEIGHLAKGWVEDDAVCAKRLVRRKQQLSNKTTFILLQKNFQVHIFWTMVVVVVLMILVC